jgi:hypothetical protein
MDAAPKLVQEKIWGNEVGLKTTKCFARWHKKLPSLHLRVSGRMMCFQKDLPIKITGDQQCARWAEAIGIAPSVPMIWVNLVQIHHVNLLHPQVL